MLSFLKWTPFLVNFPRDKAFLLGKKAKLDIHHLLNNEHTIHQSTFFSINQCVLHDVQESK